MVYNLDKQPNIPFRNFTLKKWLFGVTNIVKNSDKSKCVHIGYGIAFHEKINLNLVNNLARNFIIFDVDNSSSSHTDNNDKYTCQCKNPIKHHCVKKIIIGIILYAGSIIDDPMITYDEIMDKIKTVPTQGTSNKTIPTNFNEKKVTCKRKKYILLILLLNTIALLIFDFFDIVVS